MQGAAGMLSSWMQHRINRPSKVQTKLYLITQCHCHVKNYLSRALTNQQLQVIIILVFLSLSHTLGKTHKHTQQTAVALVCIKNSSDYCTATKDCIQMRYFIGFISPTMHSWMQFPSYMNSCVILNQKGWKVHFNLQKICSSWTDKAGLHVAA